MNNIKTKIFTTSEVKSKHFIASSGDGYSVFSEAMNLNNGNTVAGPKNLMIKTSELEEFAALATAALDNWKKAKEIENKQPIC